MFPALLEIMDRNDFLKEVKVKSNFDFKLLFSGHLCSQPGHRLLGRKEVRLTQGTTYTLLEPLFLMNQLRF